MKILGIETATGIGGVALVDDEKLLAESSMDMAMTHAERLMVLVDRVFKDTGLTPEDLDGMAVSIGPGSFTGLRVGVSTVKGLATGKPVPVAAVPTLEAMAWNVSPGGHRICPMIDAKKGEVYAAVYSRAADGTLKSMMEEQVILPEALCERLLEPSGSATVFLGDGVSRYREILENRLGGQALFASASLSRPFPSTVAWIGLRKFRRGEAADTRSLVPAYLRRSDAEVNWEKGVIPRKLHLKGARRRGSIR
jgi:tRNA threonylcarbamoyladenosine biosynthesis protein TsaB